MRESEGGRQLASSVCCGKKALRERQIERGTEGWRGEDSAAAETKHHGEEGGGGAYAQNQFKEAQIWPQINEKTDLNP